MTIIEALLSAAGVALVLGVLVLINRSLRADTAEDQTRWTLRTLQQALTVYVQQHGDAPAEPASAALTALLEADASGELLEPLEIGRNDAGQPMVLDGFGQPIAYYAPDQPDEPMEGFVSAGPDGAFGNLTAEDAAAQRAAADNILGSDLERTTP